VSKTPEMTHRAFSVIKRGEGQDDYWLPIGAAFEHADGKGFNVILQALPIDGKLVLRVPKNEEEDNRPPPRRDDQREKSGQRRR
jgi:hypothetical protein